MEDPATPQGFSAAAAASAAGMLDAAWTAPGVDALRAQVVRNLARDLKESLEALGGLTGEIPPADALVDGALRAADVANLAASSLMDLPGEAVVHAVAAAHLAAGAARALCALAEAAVADLEGDHAEHALRDVRSARWRARFAVRQTDEFQGLEA